MLFVQYPKCSTCRKAKNWLDEHNIEYESRHIIEDNPSAEELRKLDLLATDGMLVKRPVLVADDFVLVGFKVKEWEEKLI